MSTDCDQMVSRHETIDANYLLLINAKASSILTPAREWLKREEVRKKAQEKKKKETERENVCLCVHVCVCVCVCVREILFHIFLMMKKPNDWGKKHWLKSHLSWKQCTNMNVCGQSVHKKGTQIHHHNLPKEKINNCCLITKVKNKITQ